ncbi:hypothetical protein IID22_04745 [Patescibacteria group bacterium]|nr:hypothetical protein [Patescibacteria group bacterium]
MSIENKAIPAGDFETIAESALKRDGRYFLVKANLPDSMESWLSGNGEGMWVMIDADTKRKLDTNGAEGTFLAYLNEPCAYHPALNQEAFDFDKRTARPIEFEFRGPHRPVLVKAKLEQLLG